MQLDRRFCREQRKTMFGSKQARDRAAVRATTIQNTGFDPGAGMQRKASLSETSVDAASGCGGGGCSGGPMAGFGLVAFEEGDEDEDDC